MRRVSIICVVAAWLIGGHDVATQLAPRGEAVVLPTERASNVFFVRTTINGRGPFWFTVDTGATLTVIDPATAAALRLPTRAAGRRQVGVTAGETEMATTSGAEIRIDGLEPFEPWQLYVIPVQGNAGWLGHQIDGVLGTDFLSRYVVEFDYGAGRVSVAPRVVPTPNPASSGAVSVSIAGNVLVAPATLMLADRAIITARVLIDTGSNGQLTLTSPYVRRHKLAERFQSRELSASVGISGTAFSPVVVLPEMTVGEALMRDLRTALSDASAGLHASTDYDGIVGAELLRRFILTIDYPGRRLTLASPVRVP